MNAMLKAASTPPFSSSISANTSLSLGATTRCPAKSSESQRVAFLAEKICLLPSYALLTGEFIKRLAAADRSPLAIAKKLAAIPPKYMRLSKAALIEIRRVCVDGRQFAGHQVICIFQKRYHE